MFVLSDVQQTQLHVDSLVRGYLLCFSFFGWRLKSQSQFSDSHHSFSIHEQPTQTVTDMFGSTVSSLVNAVFEST